MHASMHAPKPGSRPDRPASGAEGAAPPTGGPPPAAAARPGQLSLLLAGGGPRYAVALAVDAVGAGLLRPFLLLYGVTVLGLGVTWAGLALSFGLLGGLAAVPLAGRLIDRGPRSLPLACCMLVRVAGVLPLLFASGHGASGGGRPPAATLGAFAGAALLLGIGNQCWPPAHAALVATVAAPELRDGALAAARSLRNAGLGAGALVATAASGVGGAGTLRLLAVGTALGYLVGGVLAGTLRVRAPGAAGGPNGAEGAGRWRFPRSVPQSIRGFRLGVLDLANLPLACCFNVLEVALPAVLTTRLGVSAGWASGIFVGNTVLVVLGQVAVVRWASRYARRRALALSGVVLAASYGGFWAGGAVSGGLGGAVGGVVGAAVLAAVAVPYTLGEILYTGTAVPLVAATTPPERLGRALARFQLTYGLAMSLSPAVMTALLACGPALLWGALGVSTLLAAGAVRRWGPVEPGR